MKISVVGMGKIGLPLAVQYAKKGNTVTGIDINAKTVELINQGLEPFPEEAHLKEYLADVVGKGLLNATLDYEDGIKSADVVVVVVPLFVNDKAEPEFSAMDHATQSIGSHLKKGALICYETTLPIGTTRTRFVPALEKESGLKVGIDFNVVFSPERVFTGRIFEDLRKYPKIVGGITQKCTTKGVGFYTQVLDFDKRDDLAKPNGVWAVESTESAEFVKLAETTYRDVNIALANQFAMYADRIGVNIYEIIQSANSQKFSQIHDPGISVGGHCIPVYPRLYLYGNPNDILVKSAREINQQLPLKVLDIIEKQIGSLNGLKVLTLGVSFRTKVKEHAFSGVFELNQLIKQKGAYMQVLDPYYSESEIVNLGLNAFDSINDDIDLIIIHTAHYQFVEFLKQEFKNCKLIYDGRNLMKQNMDKNLKIKVFGNSRSFLK
jgi:UDP-N-acetyl-D-glucosamine dehydrogenase